MLSLRLGDRWTSRGPTARDSLGLEIDGVALLPPIDDVELVPCLRAWLEALKLLIVDRAPAAQVSLDAPALEICLLRKPGLTLELTVVTLEPEPKVAARPVLIDLVEFKGALDAATRQFLRTSAEAGVDEAIRVELEHLLRTAGGRAIAPFGAAVPASWAFETTVGALALSIDDADGRTLLVNKGAGLPALLTGGSLRAHGNTSVEPPFLALLGLVRRTPTREAYELGLLVCAALHERHAGWSRNPWVDSLFVRCTEGLAAMRAPSPDVEPGEVPKRAAEKSRPLTTVGTPRRVTLRPKWTRPVALGEPRGRVELGKKTVVVHSPHAAHVFSTSGKELRRVTAPRGVAASPDGVVLAAGETKLSCFWPGELSARWIRDSGGVRLGPELELESGQLRTRLSGRGLLSMASMTGAEQWRFDPPRSQRASFVQVGERLIVGADSGDLYGLDVLDGQVRFRIRGGAAVPWPVVPLQRDAVAVLGNATQTIVARFAALAGDASHAGAIVWSRPLPLESASRPVIARGRIFVAGRADGRGAIACLSGKGEVLWLRSVPLEGATSALVAFERGVIASDARGAAVRLLPDGDTAWVLGGHDEPVLPRLVPVISKSTLVVPGATIRLVEPQSGRVLTATPREPDLTDFAVGRGLSLFTYSEPGALTCFELGTVLSVL